MTGPDHVIHVGTRWTLRREQGDGAPEAIYLTECASCSADSGWVDNEMTRVGVWAIQHTATSGHERFLHNTQVHWRVDPTRPSPDDGVALSGAFHVRCTARTFPPHRAHAPTRRRPFAPVRRAVALSARCAGPVVITALITVGGLCGYLLGASIHTS